MTSIVRFKFFICGDQEWAAEGLDGSWTWPLLITNSRGASNGPGHVFEIYLDDLLALQPGQQQVISLL